MTRQRTKKRRLCLFAGYDKDAKIDEYVIYYINELSKYSDVYYCADCEMANEELQKLSPITKGAFASRHKEYDFGSWKYILNQIGWEKVSEYDEVLLVNDSCFGPIFPLSEVFNKMDKLDLDAWSMAENKFLMSFFVGVKTSVFMHPSVKTFFDNIKAENDKYLVIKKYERGFSRLLNDISTKTGGYLTVKELRACWKEQKRKLMPEMREYMTIGEKFLIKIRGDRIRLYDDDILLLAQMRFPLLKKMAFMLNKIYSSNVMLAYLDKNSNYPLSLIKNYLNRIHHHQATTIEVLMKHVKSFIRSFVLEKKYKKDVIITRVLKIPVIIKKIK